MGLQYMGLPASNNSTMVTKDPMVFLEYIHS